MDTESSATLPFRIMICVLNGVSIGAIINYCAMAGTQYYVCDSLETPQMQGVVAVDVFRIVCAIAALLLPEIMNGKFAQKGTVHANWVLMGISIACVIAMFVMWDSACKNCVMRSQLNGEFQAGLAQMLHTDVSGGVNGGPCAGGYADEQAYWFSPQHYCREQIAQSCSNAFLTQNVNEIHSVQSCTRFGCTDFLPQGQASFLVGVIGDLARVFLFFMFATYPEKMHQVAASAPPAPIPTAGEVISAVAPISKEPIFKLSEKPTFPATANMTSGPKLGGNGPVPVGPGTTGPPVHQDGTPMGLRQRHESLVRAEMPSVELRDNSKANPFTF